MYAGLWESSHPIHQTKVVGALRKKLGLGPRDLDVWLEWLSRRKTSLRNFEPGTRSASSAKLRVVFVAWGAEREYWLEGPSSDEQRPDGGATIWWL